MRSRFNVQADFETILWPTILQGAAMAFFFIPLQAVIFSGLGPERMAAAAGLSNFVRITAGAVGTSIFTTVWENRAVLHHAELAESIHRGNDAATAALAGLRANGYDDAQALAAINRLIDQQAYTMAVGDLFLLSSFLFVALMLLVWLAKPVGMTSVDAAGAH
jgi:DHA2 family multidrug resistance protein